MSRSDVVRIADKIAETLRRYDMQTADTPVVAGFSGGADSMALVHALHRSGQRVIAAHVHHGLRGDEADRDEAAVRQFCNAHGIALEVLHADVRARARELGIGVEACGRAVRYDFFAALAARFGAKIATAHTLSDVCETVLLHLARGTGLQGLCGIPPVRGEIIRPLIDVTRAEVEAYCTHYALPFVTDSTNLQTCYARNRVRLQVVPALREVNPAFEEAVQRLTQQCREDAAYLQAQAQAALAAAEINGGYSTEAFVQMPRAVRARAMQLAIKRVVDFVPSAAQTEQMHHVVEHGSGTVALFGQVRFCVERTLLRILTEQPEQIAWEFAVNCGKTVLPDGRTIVLEHKILTNSENDINFQKILFHNSLDYGTISHNTTFRNRRAGDFFRPAGRGVTKSLKKLLNEAGIPPSQRDALALLADGSRVLWLEGFGVSQDCCITPKTTELAVIAVHAAKEPFVR